MTKILPLVLFLTCVATSFSSPLIKRQDATTTDLPTTTDDGIVDTATALPVDTATSTAVDSELDTATATAVDTAVDTATATALDTALDTATATSLDTAKDTTVPTATDTTVGPSATSVLQDKQIAKNRTGAWTTVQCDFGSLTDASTNQDNPGLRWSDAQADSAWENLVDNWNAYLSSGKIIPNWTFTNFMYDFFNAQDESDCSERQGPCPVVLCSDVNYPAGWLIINSIHQIWQGYNTLGASLESSDLRTVGELQEFQQAFAAVPDPGDDGLALALTIIGVVAGIASAGLFSKLKPQLADAGEPADFLKDSANSLINSFNLVAFRYEASLSGATDSEAIESFADLQTHLWDGTQAAANETLKSLMTGNDGGFLANLGGLIKDGNVLAANPNLESELNAVADQLLWGGLMRARWRMKGPDGQPYAPYVLYVPGSVYRCGDDPANSAPIPGDGYNLEAIIDQSVVADDVAWCDPQGNSWFLLNAYGGVAEGGNNKNLDGQKWGGITLETITQSAYEGFKANGSTNPFDLDGGPDFLSAWASPDIAPAQAPGFFNFPFCSSVDVVSNSQGDYDSDNPDSFIPPPGWPCPGDGGYGNEQSNATTPALQGQCGLHWVIYHQDHDKRAMDVIVKDASGVLTGQAINVDVTPPIVPTSITGKLPSPVTYSMTEIVFGKSADTVTFSYNGFTWTNKDSNCAVGGFDGTGNNVSGDCGFAC